MLIVHRLSRGGHRYYLATPGVWLGATAPDVGLSGDVHAVDLRRVLPSDPARVPGFDCTFAAPKSVSVVRGLGPPAVADAAQAAHDAAVRAGIAYLERHACAASNGAPARGFVIAAFPHQVSRAGDPHLHTHAVVVNGTLTGDRWRAIDSMQLYRWRRGAGAVYQAVLRHELGRRVGVTREPSAWGAEVA